MRHRENWFDVGFRVLSSDSGHTHSQETTTCNNCFLFNPLTIFASFRQIKYPQLLQCNNNNNAKLLQQNKLERYGVLCGVCLPCVCVSCECFNLCKRNAKRYMHAYQCTWKLICTWTYGWGIPDILFVSCFARKQIYLHFYLVLQPVIVSNDSERKNEISRFGLYAVTRLCRLHHFFLSAPSVSRSPSHAFFWTFFPQPRKNK